MGKAIKFILERINSTPVDRICNLLEEAALTFELSKIQKDYLYTRFSVSAQASQRKETVRI